MDDHAHVVAVRHAAEDLPRRRRALVDRRCRRVFGAYWTDLARDYPTAALSDAGSVSAWLAASVRDREHGRNPGPLDGLIQRAYSELPGHPLLSELRRELARSPRAGEVNRIHGLNRPLTAARARDR